jgi:Tfp pilus assembly protein PilN
MIRINLLAREDRRTVRRGGPVLDKTKIVPLAALSVSLTVCLVVLMLQSAREKSLEREVAVARAESEKYMKTIALIDEMVRKENELNRRLDIVQTLDKNRYRTVTVLDEMAKRVPSYLWLTTVKEVSTDRLAIDGLAFSNLVISDLMSNLEKSDVFQNVELSVARRKEVEEQTVVGFTLTTGVNGPVASKKSVPGSTETIRSDTNPTIQIPAAPPPVISGEPDEESSLAGPSGESVGG